MVLATHHFIRRLAQVSILLVMLVGLAACTQRDPAATIEAYLEARTAGDLTSVVNLSCIAWEGQAIAEVNSFSSADVTLQDMDCGQNGQDGDAILVECRGTLVATYDGEDRAWDLGGFLYRAIQEDGEWRMCGYHEGEA